MEHVDEDDMLDNNRHLTAMALQLSQQQSESNTTEPNKTTNSQHNLTDTIENMDPNFLGCV